MLSPPLLLPHSPPGFSPVAHLDLSHYQLYAVDAWTTQRRSIPLLVVFTGNPAHSVALTALAPTNDRVWQDSLAQLRHDGARPKLTPHGLLMVTSLAHFPADSSIVLIPGGHFLRARDQLYANTALLRMRCSARAALSLDDPSPSTRERFLSAFHLPDSLDLTHAVLELVKLVQAALSICGMFPASLIDGLLCDTTVSAIRDWLARFGIPCLHMLPTTEPILDPPLVAALLSLVLSTRNRLAHLGFAFLLPRDPLLHPHAFSLALAAYTTHSSPFIPPAHPPTSFLSAAAAAASPPPLPPAAAILTPELFQTISAAYHAKLKLDKRKVRRVIKNRLNPDSDDQDPRRHSESTLERSPSHSVPSIGSSGGQILHGIGSSLATGLRISTGGVADFALGPDGDSAALMAPTLDLPTFLALAVHSDPHKKRRKSKERSLEITLHGGSVKALWTGRIADVQRMRDDAAVPELSKHKINSGVVSDGDGESWRDNGRSTEEDSDTFHPSGSTPSFGGMWSGRVRGKLGSWAGLAKRKTHSVDLSSLPKGKDPIGLGPSPTPSRIHHPSLSMSRRSTNASGTGPQSPTLPPMLFVGDGPDDDDLLSSGQVSPISDYRPNPFNLRRSSTPIDGSSTNLLGPSSHELEHKRLGLHPRRFTQPTRVSSWADPISARDGENDDDDDPDDSRGRGGGRRRDSEGEDSDPIRAGTDSSFWKRKEKARFHSLLSVMDGDGVLVEELLEGSDDDDDDEDQDKNSYYDSYDETDPDPAHRRQRRSGFDPRRRRSFHDLEAFEGIEVLSPERMKIDVDICGHLLTIWRREEHLRNVLTCTRLIANSLSKTNIALRTHYESHHPTLAQISTDTAVLATIERERTRAVKILQSTNTLHYESAQFLVSSLWQAASLPRRTVFALREKVFGTGGRRLPTGTHGAHGPFNRLQWTLDGQKRLVDHLGRTESEAEEELALLETMEESGVFMDSERRPATPGTGAGSGVEDEDQGEVVEHPGIKPMWLLRFFTSWGARWSATAAASAPAAVIASPVPEQSGEVMQSPQDSTDKWTFANGKVTLSET